MKCFVTTDTDLRNSAGPCGSAEFFSDINQGGNLASALVLARTVPPVSRACTDQR